MNFRLKSAAGSNKIAGTVSLSVQLCACMYYSECFCPQGVGPTAQRAAVVAGVELPAYDLFKKKIIQSGYLGDCKETHFMYAINQSMIT